MAVAKAFTEVAIETTVPERLRERHPICLKSTRPGAVLPLCG